jgi:hypothetical protein
MMCIDTWSIGDQAYAVPRSDYPDVRSREGESEGLGVGDGFQTRLFHVADSSVLWSRAELGRTKTDSIAF